MLHCLLHGLTPARNIGIVERVSKIVVPAHFPGAARRGLARY
jgi:hypothetical protein